MIPSLRFRPRPRERRARRSRALWLAALGAVPWLAAGQAAAQECVPDPQDPLVIECSGIIPEGFESPDDGVQLTVLGNTVMTNGAAMDTIRLNDAAVVVVEPGADLTNDAAGGAAVSVVDDSVVSHSGFIRVEGAGGIGIRAQDRGSLITNLGSVIDLIGEDSVGILARDQSLSVTNEGDIGGDADRSIGISVGSENLVFNPGSITLNGADAVGVLLAGPDNSLGHSGSIEMTGAGASGVVMLGENNGMTSLGPITMEGDDSIGVLMVGSDVSLTNAEEISATGAGSVGVEVRGSAGTSSIVNLGPIRVGPDSAAAVSFALSGPQRLNVLEAGVDSLIEAPERMPGVDGVAVLGGESEELFITSGLTIGEVNLMGGRDTLQLLEEADLTDAPVSLGAGDDSLELFGGGVFTSVDGDAGEDVVLLSAGVLSVDTLDLSAISNFEILAIEAGDWTLQDAGSPTSFDSGIFLAGGVLRIDDPVSLSSAFGMQAQPLSTLALSDVLDLEGDYTQFIGSTYSVALGSGGPDGLLRVDGAASIEDGAILEILEVTPLSGSFTILSATAGITGTFTDLPEPTPVLSFALNTVDVAMGQELVLDVLRNSYTAGAQTPNQFAVAEALDGVLLADPDADMSELLAALDRVSFADYAGALDSLHPEAYDAHTSAMLGFGDTFARLAASNLSECAPSYYPYLPTWITSGPPCKKDGWTPWIGGFGSFSDRSGGSRHVDYSGTLGGVAVGAGRAFGSNWEVAGYVGGGFGSLDVKQVGDGSLQTFEVGIGAVRRIGAFSLRGVLDYGHGWHQQDRKVVLGAYEQMPKGEYESNRVTGLLEGSWQLVAAETNFFEPVASLDFTWLDEESFTETGGRGANLALAGRSQTAVSTTLGIRIERTFLKGRYTSDWAQWANGTWRPELDLRWRANWTDVDRSLGSRFARAPQGTGSFTVKAQDAKQGAEFAVGTTYQPYKTQALVTAGYRGFIGDGTQIHSVGLEVRIPF